MLAYELYATNKHSTKNDPKKKRPIKKIFYENDIAVLDKKGLEEYGSTTDKKTRVIQEYFQMPLNTIDYHRLNLPDHETGSRSPPPYVTLSGNANGKTIKIFIKRARNHRTYVLDMKTNEIEIDSNGTVNTGLNRGKYFVGCDTLFSKYVQSGLVRNDGTLIEDACDMAICEFLEHARNASLDGLNGVFLVYVLPTTETIEYRAQEDNHDAETQGIDYFGNAYTRYPNSTTKNTKFLTYDDKAFTVNCVQKENFYRNIGIGDASLGKIRLDQDKTTAISGLDWTLMDMSEPDFRLEAEGGGGFLAWLQDNYRKLASGKNSRRGAQIKIVCVKYDTRRTKQEVLIDENLTMDRMEEILSRIPDNAPKICLEVLIEKSGKNTVWNMYIQAVKNFLAGKSTPRTHMLNLFTRMVAKNRYDWIKDQHGHEEPKGFFRRADFCIISLYKTNGTTMHMDANEAFADCVGRIARQYVDFKKTSSEADNSLTDILSYSKYDRERLRFIVSRVGRGIHLSKASEAAKGKIIKKVDETLPGTEIDDGHASSDYSYFFFRGYFGGQSK